METVQRLAAVFKVARETTVLHCSTCGYRRTLAEGPSCPYCRAEAKLAEALDRLRAIDDYEAVREAAYGVLWAIESHEMGRRSAQARRDRKAAAVRRAPDPMIDVDDDDDRD